MQKKRVKKRIPEDQQKKRGPKTEPLVIESPDWKQAMGKALAKKRPAEGWPEAPVKKRAKRKKS